MSGGVFSWWVFLCTVGALNVIAWSLSAAALRRRQPLMSPDSYIACRRQLILSAVYVFGCAFRCALPVFDVPRICLFNTWLSSVIVGRTVATAAELCFVGQWALLLRHTIGHVVGRGGGFFVKAVPRVIVPLILAAEVCSWYSVLTTSNIGHVVEESLWGLSATLVVATLVAFYPRCPANWRSVLIGAAAAGLLYAAYMFLVDVPMYWSRWMADEALGRQYLSIAQGILDTSERRVVSHRWEDWKSEVVWMSLYFSVAVWISISLIHAATRRARTVGDANPHKG
jgi:hypothetical protein